MSEFDELAVDCFRVMLGVYCEVFLSRLLQLMWFCNGNQLSHGIRSWNLILLHVWREGLETGQCGRRGGWDGVVGIWLLMIKLHLFSGNLEWRISDHLVLSISSITSNIFTSSYGYPSGLRLLMTSSSLCPPMFMGYCFLTNKWIFSPKSCSHQSWMSPPFCSLHPHSLTTSKYVF